MDTTGGDHASRNARAAQRMLAVVFVVLGTPCLVAPRAVLELCVRKEAMAGSDAEWLIMGCFGSQAVLQGVLLAVCRFEQSTFLWYAVAVVPFYWFNFYFYYVRPLLNELMLLDFLGNTAMIAACIYGYRQLGAASAADKVSKEE